MKTPSILSEMRSIRTRFGLVTACTLLGLLLVFYLGGRYILVHMIRQAEKDIQVVGNDIKAIVYDELTALQRAAADVAGKLSRAKGELTLESLREHAAAYSEDLAVNLVVVLRSDGRFQSGCYATAGELLHLVEPAEIQPYLNAAPLLTTPGEKDKGVTGLIAFRNKPVFIAVAPFKRPGEVATEFVLLGSLLQTSELLSRINTATRGMQVALQETPLRKDGPHPADDPAHAGLSQVFKEAKNYYAGGRWHLGENTFEAVLPINDILGHEVTSISIRLPGTFSSIASIALGWLTSFIAFVGILFVIPIFWFQSKIVLNPLSLLTRQIKELGDNHLDGDAAILSWPKNDEFGVLAQSVNEMMTALAKKTQLHDQSEQRQRALIAGMPDCLCVFDSQANVVMIHKQPDYAHPIPGLISGRPISPPLFPENDCEAMSKAIEEAFRTERIQMVILSCREADGTYRHFETRISRMDELFALVVLRDVTKEWRERETREQVEDRLAKVAKMESLGTLAAGIAHDVNNVLAIIQNTIDNMWETPSPELDEAIGTIRLATSKGANLTRELMTYAGHTHVTFKQEDPNALILDMERLMGGVVAPNVILELKLTPNLPHVDADTHQFWKVIINLLKNASEAMNNSSGHIRISTYPLTLTAQNVDAFFTTHDLPLKDGVVFQIDDTGSGIPKEVISRIFEPFFSTKAVGRGLGLATVFGIVDSHNGGIAIASEPNKGTSFRVWLPVSETPAAPAGELPGSPAIALPAESGQPEKAVTPSARPLVLLVEDDPSILQTTAIALRSLRVEVLAAGTKRDALAFFRKYADSVGLILLDAQTGNLDNVRLLSTLRLRRSGVPTVIISGYSEARIRTMFESEPFDGFLNKPYTRGELEDVLKRFGCLT